MLSSFYSMSPKSGYRFWDNDMRQTKSMSPKSGYRFWDNDMRRDFKLAVIINDINIAAEALVAGKLVAFATETVYGLGGDAGNPAAVAGIFAAKERPAFNPLICHVHNLEAARKLAEFSPPALQLAEAFWPGPLTLILPRRLDCPVDMLASAGLDTVAVRVPSHPTAQALLQRVNRPIAAPSANPSGRLSPTSSAHVLAHLEGRIDYILEGGASELGLESTIILPLSDRFCLLRPGSITPQQIERQTGIAVDIAEPTGEKAPLAPGQLLRHYAPRARLRLDVTTVQEDEAVLFFAAAPADEKAGKVYVLSQSADLIEAAANLFPCLHQADADEVAKLAVMPIPDHGLGLAINDRLRRASSENR